MSSKLLDSTENEALRRTLGKTASPLTSTVARLYLATKDSGHWRDSGVWGPITLAIDRPLKTKFIYMFDLSNWEVRFKEELYEGMDFVKLNSLFYYFETKNALAGLSFCDDKEADAFAQRVRSFVPKPTGSSVQASVTTPSKSSGGFLSRLFGGKSSKHVEISGPTGFQHIQHIGYDPDKGFECDNINEEWKSLFKHAGIKKKDLQNPETAKVIFETLQNFAASHGGELPSDAPSTSPAPTTSSGGGESNNSSSADIPVAPTLDAPSSSSSSSVPEAPEAPEIPMAPPAPELPTDISTASTSSATVHSSGAQKSAPAPMSTADMLSGIKKVQLKKVATPKSGEGGSALPDLAKLDEKGKGDLFSTLKAAMKGRAKLMSGDDSKQENEDVDDWDD
eukprot:TRINITY_DN11885_c0_g1_i1.p1 TRINITY_DN11885_c0_g1~~TRINITY_DN11885_c0_g1_i1.p1  ORF type:complete len:394 (-),score=111.21 TRINITY_DN11885_c0_g1_i1:870-2051(-)